MHKKLKQQNFFWKLTKNIQKIKELYYKIN